MDIEGLARKLEPLIPEQVHHWLRVRETAGTRLKGLVDDEIVSAAYELLGDFRKKALLSLPSRSRAKGEIHLGTVVYEKEKWPFGISRAELLRNMFICGMSGSGKTNVAFHILEQLAATKVPWLFWDFKRTARHLLPRLKCHVNVYTPGRTLSPFLFNPFIVPPGLEPQVYITQLVDVLAEAYTLGDGSCRILQKAIVGCYQRGNHAPTIAEVLKEVEEIPGTRQVRDWKISATKALESVQFAQVASTDRTSQEALAKTLLHGNTIIELDALSHNAKKFLVPALCLWLYYVRLASADREQLRLVVFVEEAHHVLYRHEQRAKETVLNRLLRQCREIGIAMIVIDQHAHLISSASVGNAYTTLCLNQRDPSDINKAAGLSLVEDADKKYFSMLGVGEAIVKMQGDRWRRPFVVKFPLVRVRKGAVTDELLARFLNGSLSRAGLSQAVARGFGKAFHELTHDQALDEDALAFVEDVIEHEHDSIRDRYKRLGLSVDRGNRLKSNLVEAGILDEEQVKVGRTYKVLLRVTHQARTKLGLTKTLGRGSIAHEYWKNFYAAMLRDDGYEVELEAPRKTGRVDVLARKDGEQIAIEIETGKSDAVWNVKQDLLARCNKVLVVVTDESVMDKVFMQLWSAGLIIPKRVSIVVRDGLRPAA